jgi:indolepyruvate ferredoxin oxidoreductase beta subunit
MSALSMSPVVNVIFAGPAAGASSRVLAEAAFRAGHDVKQAEIRAGLAGVRFGAEVLSPLVPRGEADYLVVLDDAELDAARPLLREGGAVLAPPLVAGDGPVDFALLGLLSGGLDLPEEAWHAALAAGPAPASDEGRRAFEQGRARGRSG